MTKAIESIFFNHADDSGFDFTPTSFDDYIGQKALKKRLSVYIQAAHKRDEPLDHLLLFGPPGLGKTTLAGIIAQEMKSSMKTTSGPALQRSGDLVAILSSLKKGEILFIDEIHRIPISVEETLYTAMEQFKIDVIIGQGAGAKTLSLPLQQFTLIGATTRAGLLSAPLRSRFGITEKFDFYENEDLAEIITQSAHFFKITIDKEAADEIASCARGTPRIAKKLIRKIRDYVEVHHNGQAFHEETKEALAFFGIWHDGLTEIDRQIMKTLHNRPRQSPIGLDALAALIGEDPETIEEVYEPFLIYRGYVERTPRGRTLGTRMHQEFALLSKIISP